MSFKVIPSEIGATPSHIYSTRQTRNRQTTSARLSHWSQTNIGRLLPSGSGCCEYHLSTSPPPLEALGCKQIRYITIHKQRRLCHRRQPWYPERSIPRAPRSAQGWSSCVVGLCGMEPSDRQLHWHWRCCYAACFCLLARPFTGTDRRTSSENITNDRHGGRSVKQTKRCRCGSRTTPRSVL